MAKNLYLMRHAEAASKESRQEDRNRELTASGVKDCLHTGAWLREQNIPCDLISASSALRAEQTASLLVEGMKIEHPRMLIEDVLYEASVRHVLDYINNLEDAYHHVLIIGHNPAISYLAEYLTKADIGDMVPASIAFIRFDFASWKQVSENTGTLERLVRPEEVARF